MLVYYVHYLHVASFNLWKSRPVFMKFCMDFTLPTRYKLHWHAIQRKYNTLATRQNERYKRYNDADRSVETRVVTAD